MTLHHITHLTLQPISTVRRSRPHTPAPDPSMTTARKRSLDFLDNSEQTIVHSPVSYTPPVSPGAEKRFKGRRGSLQSAHSYREESYRDEGNGWSRSGTPTGSPPRDVQRVDEEEELHQDREQSPPRDQDLEREREREQSPPIDRELDHEQDQNLSRDLTYSPGFDPSSTQTLEPEYDMDPNPTQTQTQAHGPEYDRSPSHSPPHSPSRTPTHEPESTAPPCAQPEPISKTPSPPPPAPTSKQSPSPPPAPKQSPPPAPSTPPALVAPNPQQEQLAAPATPKPPPTPPTDDLLLQLPPHDWPSFLARFTSTLQSVGDEKERIARELDMWNWMYEIWSTSRDRDDTRRLSREMATMVQWTKMKEAELERAREDHTKSMLAISSVLGIAPKSGTPPARR